MPPSTLLKVFSRVSGDPHSSVGFQTRFGIGLILPFLLTESPFVFGHLLTMNSDYVSAEKSDLSDFWGTSTNDAFCRLGIFLAVECSTYGAHSLHGPHASSRPWLLIGFRATARLPTRMYTLDEDYPVCNTPLKFNRQRLSWSAFRLQRASSVRKNPHLSSFPVMKLNLSVLMKTIVSYERTHVFVLKNVMFDTN